MIDSYPFSRTRMYTNTITKMTHGMANRITSWVGLTFTKFLVIKTVRTPHAASKLPDHWTILVEPGDNPSPEPSREYHMSKYMKNIPELTGILLSGSRS